MVRLEEDEDFEDYENIDENKPEPAQIYDYESRRILVWVEDEDCIRQVEDTLAYLLPLATIRIAGSEKKATEFAEKEKWDTFVVDLTEEGVSTSEFVKTANNNPEIMIVALSYDRLNRDNEQNETYFEPVRKLFELDIFNESQEEEPQK